MNLLAFDTATPQMSIALSVDGDVRGTESSGNGAQASATLVPQILALLAARRVRLRDLDAIAFGRGPGAFTGLRTACSVAQGLAYGAGKPLLPIDTLHCMAEQARGESVDFDVWALLDARMGEIYAARYRHGPDGWQVIDRPMLTDPAALAARWELEAPVTIAGNALQVFGDELPTRGASLHPQVGPGAIAMLALAQAAWARGEAVDPAFALPLYLRDKVAQTTVERDAVRAARDAAGAVAR